MGGRGSSVELRPPDGRDTMQGHNRQTKGAIPEMDNRHLRVILLEDGETMHNASFDELQTMKIEYFQGTDTLYIELRAAEISETRDLDENTVANLDTEECICALTIEHASTRADIPHFSFEQIAA